MRNLLQRTIKDNISCTGIGLHSGQKIKLTLRPAPEDSGITFYRTDVPGSGPIKACLENVVHTQLATTLGKDGLVIGTVEHLMSALAGLGIDNARIDVSGPEVPIMDGSSTAFVYLIRTAGVKIQSRFKKFYVVTEPLSVRDGDKYVSVTPAQEFSVDYSISFDHPIIRNQRLQFCFSDIAFEKELSRARTFGFLHEVEYMQKNGLARGGSLANAVVIDRFRILNQDGLRYENEFIRHKILDFIGDISLMGAPIIGAFRVNKSGHTLNNMLMKELKAAENAWNLVELTHPVDCAAQNIAVPSWGMIEKSHHQAAA